MPASACNPAATPAFLVSTVTRLTTTWRTTQNLLLSDRGARGRLFTDEESRERDDV